jgi:RNA polymerase sigma-70 factor (ECF subfamily)
MVDTRSTLLRRARDPADAAAWGELVALYRPLLRAYVLKRAAPGTDVEDVVQEVLARLVRALPGFDLDRARGRFRTWLWRVTYHVMADRDRSRDRRERAERARARDGLVPPAAGPDAKDGEPDADWLALHRRRVLEYAKDQVRARCRPRTWACFEQHVLRGRTSGDVAAELGISAGAVDTNSSRVLARLRDYCRTYLEGLADGDDSLPG